MKPEKEEKIEEKIEDTAPDGKLFFYVALCACVFGAVALGLAFTVLGIYALIASVLVEYGALAFLNAQKKRGNFTACKVIRIICYVIIALDAALLIGVTIYKGLNLSV